MVTSLPMPDASITVYDERLHWLGFFDRKKALAAVVAHIHALPSSENKERHTLRVYEAGLKYFLDWIGDALPTADTVQGFIAHLKQKGLKSSTIGSKYLAPVRLYLKKLSNQQIDGLTGPARDLVADCREHMRRALALPTPKPDRTSNVAALWREGVRLEQNQVNAILRRIDRDTLSGKRDYALLLVGFLTALRAAELARITLDSITEEADYYLLTVRGKRNNYDPVPLPAMAYEAILDYVNAWNDGLEPGDARRITGDRPLWQPMRQSDNYPIIGKYRYDPARGMSYQAITDLIKRRTEEVKTIAPHDMRRTAAAMAYEAGMPLTDIQALLRHKSAAVTLVYIGEKPDYKRRDLTNWVNLG